MPVTRATIEERGDVLRLIDDGGIEQSGLWFDWRQFPGEDAPACLKLD